LEKNGRRLFEHLENKHDRNLIYETNFLNKREIPEGKSPTQPEQDGKLIIVEISIFCDCSESSNPAV